MSNSQQNIPHQLEINPLNNITRSNTETTPPLQIPKRIPQALKCLADFNNPGLNERWTFTHNKGLIDTKDNSVDILQWRKNLLCVREMNSYPAFVGFRTLVQITYRLYGCPL